MNFIQSMTSASMSLSKAGNNKKLQLLAFLQVAVLLMLLIVVLLMLLIYDPLVDIIQSVNTSHKALKEERYCGFS